MPARGLWRRLVASALACGGQWGPTYRPRTCSGLLLRCSGRRSPIRSRRTQSASRMDPGFGPRASRAPVQGRVWQGAISNPSSCDWIARQVSRPFASRNKSSRVLRRELNVRIHSSLLSVGGRFSESPDARHDPSWSPESGKAKPGTVCNPVQASTQYEPKGEGSWN
jgi:hypothetical protein